MEVPRAASGAAIRRSRIWLCSRTVISACSRLLGLVLFPLRLVLLTLAELIAFAACVLVSFAANGSRTDVPLSPKLRWIVTSVVSPMTFVLLWSVSFTSVRVRGTRDPAARLIVSNHQSLADGFVITAALGAPSFVAREAGLSRLPLFATIFRTMQCVFVENSSSESRAAAAAAIRARLTSTAPWPPLAIFPEGRIYYREAEHAAAMASQSGSSLESPRAVGERTPLADTDSPREFKDALAFPPADEPELLLPFRDGAFRPAVPCQPVLLWYPDSPLARSPSNGLTGELALVLRMMLQPSSRCVLELLPVYSPSEEERANPKLYAANVRDYMLRTLETAVETKA